MTTAKKIISIILAAALVIGSVAVTAFAETVVDGYEGSELTYWFDSDKTDDNGVTKLVPGDTITVTLSARTNYYWGVIGSELVLWNNELQYTKGNIVFSDICETAFAPKEAAVTTASLYSTGTSAETHQMYKLSRQTNTDNTEAVAPNQDVLLYTWEFTLAEDAEIGSTVSVILPAEKVMTETNKTASKFPIYQTVNATETPTATPASKYAETVVTDTLDIQVVETYATEEPEETVVSGYEGSKLTYWFDSDRTENGVTKLVPGDEITVTLSARTNYYWGVIGSELVLWNNELAYTKGSIEFSEICETAFAPKEAAVTTASLYATGTSAETHQMYKLSRQTNTDNTEAVAPNQDVLLYTWTFTLAADAEVGSTVSVILPAEKVMTETNKTASKFPIYQTVNATETPTATPASKYAETVVTDTLEIQVVSSYEGGTEPPVVEYADLTALKDAIAKAATADTANCTSATVAEFNEALAAANALNVEGTLASEQETINAAAKRLEDAITGLAKLPTVSYTALNDAIAAYEAKLPEAGNYSNWAAYEALYNTAAAIDQTVVYDDEAGSIQAAVDAAAEALDTFVLTEYGKVNYTALNDAIAAYEAKLPEAGNYSNWAAYEALYNEAKAIDQSVVYDKNGEQAAADAAAEALNTFVLTEYAKVNYDALNDAIVAYEAKLPNANLYANWAEYEALYNVAKAIDQSVVYDKNGEQAEVDAAAEALANFQLEDKTLSYDKWNAAVNAIPADLAGFKPASVTAYEAAKAQAEADKDAAVAALDQTALDAAADALTAAIALLEAKADNSALVAAVARASALLEENYTPDSWVAADLANVLAAANVVLANGDATAEEIEEQVAAIKAAEDKLVVKADKAALLEALQAAQALVANEAAYTPASFAEANLAAEIAAAQVVYDDDNATAQAVADAIVALKAAAKKLVLKADKADLEAAILMEVILDNATAETLAEYNAKLQAAQAVLADDNASEEEVLAATNNLLAAIDGLKYYGACDYEAYDKAVADANALVADKYTTSSWAAADIEAVLAANYVEPGLMDKDGNQDKIDAAATAINAAIALLEEKADVTALADAVAKDPKVPEQYATVETWTAYAQAKAEAQDILDNAPDTGVSAQGAVDAAAKALNDANDALAEKPADYTAVEEALEYVKTKGDLNQYTSASVKKLNAAINAVVYGLGISKQQEVDDAAAAIVDAANALVISEAAVTNVEADFSEYYERGALDYTFTVTGAPTRLQIVYPNGSTMTYDRYNRYIDVVSYNEAGDVVDYAEVAPAYEKWTISIALAEGTYQAKAKIGSVWEAFAYDFTVEYAVAPDPREEEVIFVAKQSGTEVEAGKTLTAELGSVAEVTVIVPDTVVKVMIAYPAYGNEATFTRDNASVVDNGDGTCTWTVARNVPANGKYEMTLSLKDKSGWYAPNTEAIEVLVNYVEEVDNRDAEVTMVAKPVGSDVEAGATLAIAKNTAAEVTVVVPDTVVKLQLCIPTNDGIATYAASNATIVDNGDGTCTWTVIRNFRALGNYDMTLKLKDSKGWYDANATAIAVECE